MKNRRGKKGKKENRMEFSGLLVKALFYGYLGRREGGGEEG
jgi:hypothetical protein